MTTQTIPSIAAIIVSTRPRRNGPLVARWVHDELADRTDLDVSIVDLADIGLPLLDEPHAAHERSYVHAHTRAWSEIVDAADGFIMVTAEHNRSIPASFKNALDCLFWEWQHKPIGFVSYSGGASGGIRAVEIARQVATTLSMLPVNAMVNFPCIDSLINDGTFQPPSGATDTLDSLADGLVAHLDASRLLRSR